MADNEKGMDIIEIAWMCALGIFVPFLLWFVHKQALIDFSVGLITPQFWFYTTVYPSLIPDAELARMTYFISDSSYLNVTKTPFISLLDAWRLAGIGGRVIAIPIFIYWLVRMWFTERSSDYAKMMPRDKLVKMMAPYFVNLPPIVGENIHTLPLHVGPWRIPRSYANFACEQQLLLYKKKDVFPAKKWTHKQMSLTLKNKKKLMADQDYLTLDRAKTDRYFTQRLGSAFTSFDAMPTEHMKAICGLYCAFIAKGAAAAQEVSAAERLMVDSYSMKGSRLKDDVQTFTFDASAGIKLLNKYGEHPDVLEVLDTHGFNITVVMGLYLRAGKSSKVTTNTILWCRLLDNRLFLSLNQIGGRSAIPEVSGEWAHFYCEVKWGGKLEKPVIEGATDALEQSLLSEGWIKGLLGMDVDPFHAFLRNSHAIAKGTIS